MKYLNLVPVDCLYRIAIVNLWLFDFLISCTFLTWAFRLLFLLKPLCSGHLKQKNTLCRFSLWIFKASVTEMKQKVTNLCNDFLHANLDAARTNLSINFLLIFVENMSCYIQHLSAQISSRQLNGLLLEVDFKSKL